MFIHYIILSEKASNKFWGASFRCGVVYLLDKDADKYGDFVSSGRVFR